MMFYECSGHSTPQCASIATLPANGASRRCWATSSTPNASSPIARFALPAPIKLLSRRSKRMTTWLPHKRSAATGANCWRNSSTSAGRPYCSCNTCRNRRGSARPDLEVPALIVGRSLVGMSAAMLLGHHGIRATGVEHHRGTAILFFSVTPDMRRASRTRSCQ